MAFRRTGKVRSFGTNIEVSSFVLTVVTEHHSKCLVVCGRQSASRLHNRVDAVDPPKEASRSVGGRAKATLSKQKQTHLGTMQLKDRAATVTGVDSGIGSRASLALLF